MSHFNLISLVVKLEVLNIDWGLVFIIYSKYPRTGLIWLIKSIIAPRGVSARRGYRYARHRTGEQDILYPTPNIVMMAH